jgi:hypothetical protein
MRKIINIFIFHFFSSKYHKIKIRKKRLRKMIEYNNNNYNSKNSIYSNENKKLLQTYKDVEVIVQNETYNYNVYLTSE